MSHRLGSCLMLVLVVSLVGCGGSDDESTDASTPAATEAAGREIVVAIEPTPGNEITGTATFTEAGDSVRLHIEVQNAPPGEHAFHLHEVGDCGDGGKAAGGHWNPTAADHGKWGVDPYHLGDVGNIVVGEDGTGSYDAMSNVWSIGTGDDNDIIGHSIIVHAAADDFTTQPTGNAGGRIGCGIIQ